MNKKNTDLLLTTSLLELKDLVNQFLLDNTENCGQKLAYYAMHLEEFIDDWVVEDDFKELAMSRYADEIFDDMSKYDLIDFIRYRFEPEDLIQMEWNY